MPDFFTLWQYGKKTKPQFSGVFSYNKKDDTMELGKKYFAVDLKQPIATAITEGVCHQFTINNAGWISVAIVPERGNVVLAKVKSCFETRADAEMFYENNHKRQAEIDEIAKEANAKIDAIREIIFGKPEFPEMAVGYVAPKEEPKTEGE